MILLKKSKAIEPLTSEEIVKYEIAAELGLSEKLAKVGWGGLTAQETGRIGGIITSKRKSKSNKEIMGSALLNTDN